VPLVLSKIALRYQITA